MKTQRIPVEVSARHIHLSEKVFIKLFGKDAVLHPLRTLSQKGEFSAVEQVRVMNKRNEMKLRVVGPLRAYNQAELSATDARLLAITPPLRRSGNVKGASLVTLIGPVGKTRVSCAILQRRHLHASPQEAKKLGLRDGGRIKIKLSGSRALVFDEVEVKVANNFQLTLHLDTDEANAALVNGKTYARIVT